MKKYIVRMIFAEFPKEENKWVFTKEEYDAWKAGTKPFVNDAVIFKLQGPDDITRIFGKLKDFRVMIEVQVMD